MKHPMILPPDLYGTILELSMDFQLELSSLKQTPTKVHGEPRCPGSSRYCRVSRRSLSFSIPGNTGT